MSAATMTAEALIGQLRRHYLPEGRPPAGLFATEIQAPNSTRRADALWMPLTETGGGLIGFEVKVSRVDVINELADPTKADAWARYCSRWWLVVPDPALIEGLDIPDAWGVMSPPSGRRTRSMTVCRVAPPLQPHDGGPAFRRLLAWYFTRTHSPLALARERQARDERTIVELRERVAELGQAAGLHGPSQQRITKILQRVEQSNADDWIYSADQTATDDDIVQAVVDASRVREATEQQLRHLDSVRTHLEAAVAPARDMGDLVNKLRTGAAPSTRVRRIR